MRVPHVTEIGLGAAFLGVIGSFVSLGIIENKYRIAREKAPEIEAIVEGTEVFPESSGGLFDKNPKRPSSNNFVSSRGMYAGYPWYAPKIPGSVYLTVKLPNGSKRIFEYWNYGPDNRIVNSIVEGYKPGTKVTFKDGFTIPQIPEAYTIE